jgi:glycosyltransferase involved in cell wall biosynthesis
MIKVLHIATTDYGGAGIATWRIHEALLKQGIESRMLVKSKHSYDDSVIPAQPNMGLYLPPANYLQRKIEQVLRRRGKCLTQVERYEREMDRLDHLYVVSYTSPVSNYDLSVHPLVQEADIIHLHWIENFVDYPTFFQKVSKPIVWTFHDENIAFGGFHYHDEAAQLKDPYAELESIFVKIKKEALTANLNIHMVALSKQMEQFYHVHAIQPNYPIGIIHNGIQPENHPCFDRDYCRKVLGITPDRTTVCFCASNINDKYKGLDTLVQALEQLNNPNLTLLCVGKGNLPKSSVDIIGTGPISNPRLLSIAYSAANLFAMPSYQEAFAQTPLEAMSCGCPVVAFPCSGTEELITPADGVRCSDFTVESLVAGIQKALETQYNREAISKDVVERFSISKIAGQYIEMYNQLCK